MEKQMKELVEFTVNNKTVFVNPQHVESILNQHSGGGLMCTKLCMVSGQSLMLDQDIEEVVENLLD